MKDSGVKACVGMVCVTAIYAVYMSVNAIAGNEIPAGVVLTGVVGVVPGLAVARSTEKAKAA